VGNTEGNDEPPTLSGWQRFLAGKTTVQRLVIALGALAGAVLAIGGVVAGAAHLLHRAPAVGPATGEVQEIQNQQETADDFVRFLLHAAATKAPVPLDHKVFAPRGPGGEYRLEYACGSTGCSLVRLETPIGGADGVSDRVWYQGCWSVVKDGNGYGAEHLDLELRRQGETCPG
jgi:hypothetical protein